MAAPAEHLPFPTGTALAIALVMAVSAPPIEWLADPGPGLHPYVWTAVILGPSLLAAAGLSRLAKGQFWAQAAVLAGTLVAISVVAVASPAPVPGGLVRPAAVVPLVIAAAVLVQPAVVLGAGLFSLLWMALGPAGQSDVPLPAQIAAQAAAIALSVGIAYGWRRSRLLSVEAVGLSLEVSRRQVEQAAIARFVRYASHELRTPMTPIRLAASTLEQRGDDPAVRGRALEQLDRQMIRLTSIIDRLSAIAASTGAHVQEPQDLVAALRVAMGEQSVGLEAPDDAWVSGPPGSAKVIVEELMDNAARARRSTVRVRVVRDAAFWHLTVEDDGEGIPDTLRAAMHEPFARVGLDKHPGERSGLGLALVDAMAIAAGGRFDVQASSLGGIQMSVRLPCAQSA